MQQSSEGPQLCSVIWADQISAQVEGMLGCTSGHQIHSINSNDKRGPAQQVQQI